MKEVITSAQNPKVKELVKFRSRNGRTSENTILIEDAREIERAVQAGVKFLETFICEEILSHADNETVSQVLGLSGKVYFLSKTVFEKAAYKKEPFGIIVKAEFKPFPLGSIDRNTSLILVAERIEKPGNLGALIRTADGAGINTIILCDKITDYRNPNTIRASTGTIFSKKIIEATSAEAVNFLKNNGFHIVSADPYGDKMYYEADMSKKTAVVVGSEAFGLSDVMKEGADILVSIPMKGIADSLNVNQAATIILYEAVRQRGAKNK